jgi:S1-C subfamily serine protease
MRTDHASRLISSSLSHTLRRTLALPLLLLAGCQWEILGGSDTHSPAVPMTDYAQQKIERGPRKRGVWGPDQRDPSAEPIASFCHEVAAKAAPLSIACFPLVTHDMHREQPWVSELGVSIAEEIAQQLGTEAHDSDALGPEDVALRLSEANLARSSMTSLETVAGATQRLRVGLVSFGTIRRRDRVGAADRDVLSCELQAYEVDSGRVIASRKWEIPSDDATLRQAWDLAQAESAWLGDSRWNTAEAVPTLMGEFDIVAAELADKLAPQLPADAGTVYVAPLDTAAFVRALAQLNAARAAFAVEYGRRYDAGMASAQPMDTKSPLVLDGTEFPDLQRAEAYLATLGTSLQATDAARFAQAFSGLIGDQLQRQLRSAGTVVRTLPTMEHSADQLVNGQLASGGLASSAAARKALNDAGIALVIAPRLERLGGVFQVRVEAWSPATGNSAGTATAVLSPALAPEIEKQLGAEAVAQPVAPAQATAAWEKVYSNAKSGVVNVIGPTGRGTGFVVGDDGLIVTNDHVLAGIGSPFVVMVEGGKELPASAVMQDAYWDLAAIRAPGLPKSTHVFDFAPSVSVGTEVAVLGNPKESAGWVFTPGYVSSVSEMCATSDGRERPSLMYTCPTRQGSSGSPVLLKDGRVAAVHFGGHVGQSLSGSSDVTELTGFALGVPASEASAFVARARQHR